MNDLSQNPTVSSYVFTYSCLSDDSLTKLVEVNEELTDADSVLDNLGLDFLLRIVLMTEHGVLALVGALMTVG